MRCEGGGHFKCVCVRINTLAKRKLTGSHRLQGSDIQNADTHTHTQVPTDTDIYNTTTNNNELSLLCNSK